MNESNEKLLVTFALFAYNQEKYIREAVEGALAQDYSPLEIILSDDCSTDATFKIMCEMVEDYTGKHSIRLNRNSNNIGVANHLNKIIRSAKGEFVVIASGDDISMPMRTSELAKQWRESGRINVLITSDFQAISADSEKVDLNEVVFKGPWHIADVAMGNSRILGATVAYTKAVISSFEPLLSSVIHEDRVFPFRTLLLEGSILFCNQKLVKYRIEGGVSRTKPSSVDNYLNNFLFEYHHRLLQDAIQRNADIYSTSSKYLNLTRTLEKVINTHHAMMLLTKSSGLRLELNMLHEICGCSDKAYIFKYYLKKRFIAFYRLYFNRRIVK